MDVTWHSFDFLTGKRGAQVTTRTLGQVSRVLCEATTTTLDVLCWDEQNQAAVPGWDAATQPGRTMLVALDEDERILWGGLVVSRHDGGEAWQAVALATCEAYLDRRFVGGYSVTGHSQTYIVRELIQTAGEVNFEVGATSHNRDRTYLSDDDKTILSALTELSEVENGPEFTCELRWADATNTTVKRVWVARDRIGRSSAVSFEMPGNVVGYTYLEDYSAENGANSVMAVSSGEGDTRPASDVQVDVPAGWATFEHRFTPSTSITRTGTLNNHARRRLAVMRDGLTSLSFEARLDVAPLPGVDFHLGDDVRVVITSPRFPTRVDADGATVAGLDTTLRVVGYTLDFDGNRLVPVVQEA